MDFIFEPGETGRNQALWTKCGLKGNRRWAFSGFLCYLWHVSAAIIKWLRDLFTFFLGAVCIFWQIFTLSICKYIISCFKGINRFSGEQAQPQKMTGCLCSRTPSSARERTNVSMHSQLCSMWGHQSGVSKLLWHPLMDWHHRFQAQTTEAAAFHPNWTIKQLIELMSTWICTREEDLICEMICSVGWTSVHLWIIAVNTQRASENIWEDRWPTEGGLDLLESNMAQNDLIQAIWGYLHPTTPLTLTQKVRWTTN